MCGPRIQETWEFVHPRPDILTNSQGLPITNTHNVRSAHLTFHIPHAGTLHGLAGYFEAVLYDDVGISIHPERMDEVSKDMLSWFPIFFPFKVPLLRPARKSLKLMILSIFIDQGTNLSSVKLGTRSLDVETDRHTKSMVRVVCRSVLARCPPVFFFAYGWRVPFQWDNWLSEK